MSNNTQLIELAPTFLPRTAKEAIAYYTVRKPQSRAEILNLARLALVEVKTLNTLLDEAILRCEDSVKTTDIL